MYVSKFLVSILKNYKTFASSLIFLSLLEEIVQENSPDY